MTVKRDERRPGRPWVIDIPYKDVRSGKRRRYYKNAKLQTADGARKEERLLLTILVEKGYIPEQPEVVEQADVVKAEMTFDDAFELYENTRAQKLKPSTDIGYRKNVTAHLKPRFGSWPLSKIDKAALVAFEQELAKDGLSESTRNNIIIPLRTIITNAVELGRHDKVPAFPKLNRVKSKVYEPPSIDEVDAMLSVAESHAKLAIALAVFAGLRAGEVRGLRWSDVNLKSKVLFVRRSICHGIEDAPKSGHERPIPLAPRLAELLGSASKQPHRPSDPVAPSAKGKVFTESGLRSAFKSALTKAKLPATRFHALRHFFITKCFEGGASAPTVQRLAGHLHLSVTQRYAHTNDEAMREAVQVFAAKGSPQPGV